MLYFHFNMTTVFIRRCFLLAVGLLLATTSLGQCNQNYIWAVWNSFTGMEATGTISTPMVPSP